MIGAVWSAAYLFTTDSYTSVYPFMSYWSAHKQISKWISIRAAQYDIDDIPIGA